MSNKNIDYNSKDIKSYIINYLYNCINISKYKYELINNFNDIQPLKDEIHHVSPNFSGKNNFIVFLKINKNFYSILVDRTTLKYNKNNLNFDKVKFFPLNVKAKQNIYDGTILDGKLIKTKTNKLIFLITDVFILEGKNMLEDKLENKLINIKIYLEKNIKIDNFCKITFDINKLYKYNDIHNIIKENKNHELYNLYGIIFYPKKSGITKIFNNIELVSDKDKYAYIQLKKKDLPDVYDTFILNDDKLNNTGIAYIPTIELSQYCSQVFSYNHSIIFKCKWNNKFDKWEPIEKANNISKPDTLDKIKKFLHK